MEFSDHATLFLTNAVGLCLTGRRYRVRSHDPDETEKPGQFYFFGTGYNSPKNKACPGGRLGGASSCWGELRNEPVLE